MKKNMKWYRFVETPLYKTADVVEVFDTSGREVSDYENIDNANVVDIQVRGGWISVTIKRPKITYNDILCITNSNGSYTCSCRCNGYYIDRTYIFYPKREALKLFHDLVNKAVR